MQSWVSLVVVASILLLLLILLKRRKKGKLWYLPVVDGPYIPVLGHAYGLVRNGGNLFALLVNEWSRLPVAALTLSGERVLVNDPDLAVAILISKDFEKGPREGAFKRVFRESLASQQNYDTWYSRRTLLRPVFSKTGLAQHLPEIHRIFRDFLERTPRGQVVNATLLCQEATFAVLYKVIFDGDIQSPSFRRALGWLTQMNRDFVYADADAYFQRTISSWLPAPSISKCLQIQRNIHELVETEWLGTSSARRIDPPGVLGLLAKSPIYDHDAILDESLVFLFGGYDTTAVALQHLVKAMYDHPAEWTALKAMVRKHWNTVSPVEPLVKGPLADYLEAFIKESMRLSPAVGITVRYAIHDTEIQGLHVPEHQDVFINTCAVLRNPTIWGSDAGDFKPSRWLEGGSAQKLDKYWFPFGGGRRICIGASLSMYEQQVFLGNLAQMMDSIRIPDAASLSFRHGITNAYNKDVQVVFD